MVGREELDAADRSGARAFDRGVAVEALEVIERPLLELLQDERER